MGGARLDPARRSLLVKALLARGADANSPHHRLRDAHGLHRVSEEGGVRAVRVRHGRSAGRHAAVGRCQRGERRISCQLDGGAAV